MAKIGMRNALDMSHVILETKGLDERTELYLRAWFSFMIAMAKHSGKLLDLGTEYEE